MLLHKIHNITHKVSRSALLRDLYEILSIFSDNEITKVLYSSTSVCLSVCLSVCVQDVSKATDTFSHIFSTARQDISDIIENLYSPYNGSITDNRKKKLNQTKRLWQ